MATKTTSHYHEPTPPLVFSADCAWHSPSDEQCRRLWDRYDMPEHIREHSRKVAILADFVAESVSVAASDSEICAESIHACAMLHDIAKAYTIEFGGNHSQLGAAIVMQETGNPQIAQGILHHVHWPWELDVDSWFLPLAIIYADKRVMHEDIVSLDERFDDIVVRYGRTDFIIERINESRQQAKTIEDALSRRLGIALDAYTFDSGRMVKRA